MDKYGLTSCLYFSKISYVSAFMKISGNFLVWFFISIILLLVFVSIALAQKVSFTDRLEFERLSFDYKQMYSDTQSAYQDLLYSCLGK